jgi:hypothetical protein
MSRPLPYGCDMDTGRVAIGASIIGAIVLAAGLVVETLPTQDLTTDVTGGGVCVTLPEGSTSASSWFMADFRNETGHDVRVRTVRVDRVEGVRLEHLAIAPSPDAVAPGLVATETAARPTEYGTTVPVDSGLVVRAHGELDVVGRIVLEPDRTEGYARGVTVTMQDGLGRIRTVSQPVAFGVGIDQGQEQEPGEISCPGT